MNSINKLALPCCNMEMDPQIPHFLIQYSNKLPLGKVPLEQTGDEIAECKPMYNWLDPSTGIDRS